MAGQVKHIKIFGGFVPDLTAMSLMGRLEGRNTDALIGAVADLMRERGVELVDSRDVSAAAAGGRGAVERAAPSARRSARTWSSAIAWRTLSPASTSARPSP